MPLACLWNRHRLERHVDGALSARAAHSVAAHVDRCVACRREVERLNRLRTLVHGARPEPTDPDWASFWPGIQAGIMTQAPKPVSDGWWLPLWKPFWGHPRLVFGGVLVSVLTAVLMLWPSPPVSVPTAMATPVVVQDVAATDPERSVMVYSSPDDDVTVIWVFNSDDDRDDQS